MPLRGCFSVDPIEDGPSEVECRCETTFTKKPRSTTTIEWNRVWVFKIEVRWRRFNRVRRSQHRRQDFAVDPRTGSETASEIATEMACAISTVSKFAKRLETKKLIEIKRRRYSPRGMMAK